MGTKNPGEAATSRGMTNLRMSEIDMTKPTARPCETCGAHLFGRGGRKYCGPDCRPRCSVPNCLEPTHTKGMCSAHSSRAARYGDPLAPKVRGVNAGPCSVVDCQRPMRKTGLCASHYAMKSRYGEIRHWNYRWADETDCLVCGKPNGDFASRKFCSASCTQYFIRNGSIPDDVECRRCGAPIDLTAGTKRRGRIRVDVKLCRRCKSQSRTEATPGELARDFGPFCQLCGCDVDLLATAPDPMRASVDHIIPRAWGGSDAAENNQLTHLRCNQVKSDHYLDLSWRSKP